MKKFYLAYGSNLNVSQMAARCPDAVAVGYTFLEDCRLVFRGSRSGYYLTVEPFLGGSVPCGVWRLSEKDERMLDRYEGFPSFYGKETRKIEMVDGSGALRKVEAMIYLMVPGRPAGVPTESYFRTCARGYRDFGFSLVSLQDALSDSVALIREEVS